MARPFPQSSDNSAGGGIPPSANRLRAPSGEGPRTLICTTCKTPVTVHEIPVQFIDPARFVCGHCLVHENATLEPREETRTYDPNIADIGF